MNKSILPSTNHFKDEEDKELQFTSWLNFNFKLITALCSLGIGAAVLFVIFVLST
jgi:hypothetical protein